MPHRRLFASLLALALVGCRGEPLPRQAAESPAVAQPSSTPEPPTVSVSSAPDESNFADVQPDEIPDDAPAPVAAAPSDAPSTPEPVGRTAELPNGRKVVPAGKTLVVDNLPYDCALSPDGRWLAVLHGGQHAHGVDLIDTEQGTKVQTLTLTDSFRGIAWAPDGRRLYVSGSADKFLHVLRLGTARLTEESASEFKGHAAGIAVARDGSPLVADDTTDRLHKVGTDGRPSTYYDVGKTPFTVVTDPLGNAYVACWGSQALTIVLAGGEVAQVKVGSHPTGLAVRPDKAEVWVANTNDDTLSVVDVATRKVTRTVAVPAYEGAPPGAAPVALAFAPDGKRLYVAQAGANVLAVVDPEAGKVVGRIPTAWYPSGLAVAPDGKKLYVSCAKGFGQGPRKNAPVWKMKGSVQLIDTPDAAELAALTTRADQANHFDVQQAEPAWLPPIKHVVYVLRENRTYDQVLGDLPRGDGDPSLAIYGREVTPNIHALAERFAFGDHFLCDGEVSAQGHEWAQGAIATDATERLYPAEYAKNGRWADASQRLLLYTDTDYLVERCVRKHVSVRVYGEALRRNRDVNLKDIRSSTFKGWDLRYPDMDRVAAWEKEFKAGIFPAFSHVWLPRDHTMATIPFVQTPRSMVADNDAATGRLVDVLSHDPRWKDTLVIIQEDDAQGGYDHVDGHRSVMVLASPWIKGGTVTSKHYSQVALVATVGKLLDLGTLTQFDAKAPILDDVWTRTPDMRPFTAIAAKVSLTELNPVDGPLAKSFTEDDFEEVDDGDQALMARALWLEARTRR
ncbi:MAG: hypothetical protein JWM80_695 [Cyanobacteria bacterium RYN_339]|nr:hypothetical protein [Cyanobacteria bacterium RYN_339]